MTCAPVINGIYLLNYLWLKNQEVPEKIPKETGEYKKEKTLLILLLEALKEDNSKSFFLSGVVATFKMPEGSLSCSCLDLHPVENSAL